ncbi:CARDB domain-containing protein [Phytomonospora endophytica]|uniref:CARDB domain-containing protein n=1 Tax=Phytomonospora endophytica TaxID=714109 RepID=A0A841FSV0_9ACTN|nr:CARDB domain-containing protein [Phytomonospora endophytica]MBB6036828.1 hypothetical protein [Phytomonospora endophytica]GIG68138.1 hypothetical protein Pen01_44330 [Phytomonospora endophytica]
MTRGSRVLAMAGALMVAVGAGAPAFADPSTEPSAPAEVSADLSVEVAATEASIDGGTKPVRVTVRNDGPDTVSGAWVEVVIDDHPDPGVSLDPVPELGSRCEIAERADDPGNPRTIGCALGELRAGAVNHDIVLEFRHEGVAVGEAGTGTATVRSPSDPNPANDSDPFTLTVTGPGVDLAIRGPGEVTVAPGTTGAFSGEDFLVVTNEGGAAVDGFTLSLTLPRYASFVPEYENCSYTSDGRGMTCDHSGTDLPADARATLFPGGAPLHVKVASDAPGDVGLGRAEASVASPGAHARKGKTGHGGGVVRPSIVDASASGDQGPGDNSVDFAVFTGGDPADLAVTVVEPVIDGTDGETFEIPVTVENKGPGAVGAFTVTMTSSHESYLEKSSVPCRNTGDTNDFICDVDEVLAAGEKTTLTFTLTYGKSPGGSWPGRMGDVAVSGGPSDPDLSNNTVDGPLYSLNGSTGGGGGLPVTGASLGLAGVAALALLATGGGLVLLARRREASRAAATDPF